MLVHKHYAPFSIKKKYIEVWRIFDIVMYQPLLNREGRGKTSVIHADIYENKG